MNSKSVVCNAKKWISTIDSNHLRTISTPSLGTRHVPVNHGEIVDIFRDNLGKKKIDIVQERGLLSPDFMKYIFVVDIKTDATDYNFTLGFVNYNNKAKTFRGFAGEKVFVCSNEMISNLIETSARRHTTNVMAALGDKVDNIVEHYFIFREQRTADINVLKSREFSESHLAQMVLAMHRENFLGNAFIDRVIEEYDNPRHEEFKEKTIWSFQNACTEIAKEIDNPERKIVATNRINGLIKQIAIAA